jgi:ferritin-like metal-binding protein YciE
MKLDSLKSLYTEELRDLYSAENLIIKALPKMAKAASNPELQEAIRMHLDETKEHVARLTMIFERLETSPKRKTCKAMEGLMEEGQELMKQKGAPEVRDAGLISTAQRIEHYEMAVYGTVGTFARLLGGTEAGHLLRETLQEEGRADEKLTELAEQVVNREALELARGRSTVPARECATKPDRVGAAKRRFCPAATLVMLAPTRPGRARAG